MKITALKEIDLSNGLEIPESMQNLTESTQNQPVQDKGWSDEFDKLCIVNINGKCKYWNPESFGYAPGDSEAPLDKFFPERIKEIIFHFVAEAEAKGKQAGAQRMFKAVDDLRYLSKEDKKEIYEQFNI